ncbi:hypothetical protein UFOVP236_14 [uncultured Caudovirales phage]|uniref:Uncharacterized protein n=1 Tax=uncultured Caudovirales phage TaxID=2100421 RepID=A0A6J7WTX5_9CAUD|nr:hypothetical protein UFOVP236_14 [uncultured Caudovirales phage]
MAMVRKVRKNTALNPVARAIAKEKLKQEIVTQRISIYLMNEGEDVRDAMVLLSLPVYAVMMCFEHMGEDSADVRKLKSGCMVLKEISERNFEWKLAYARTLDNALEICERRWSKLDPRLLNSIIGQLESVG